MPFAPVPEADLFPDEDVLELALTEDFSMDSVTSGSDPTLWDPIRVFDAPLAEDQKEEEEEAGKVESKTPSKDDDGVTSGADSDSWVKAKASERKSRNPR
jgi:hypothetical protein